MNTPIPAPSGEAPAPTGWLKRAGLIAVLVALAAVVLMPSAQGLPASGQVMLGILAFAVLVWMTEALDYAVSAVVIGALMIFLLAFAPAIGKTEGDMGTSAALGLAMSGFSSSAVALVADRHPPGLCQRHRPGLDHDPHRHQRAHGRANAWH